MSTTAGIAAASVAISAQNSAALSRIKKEQCVIYVERYESQGATVAEMKQYAECVDRLNPDPMPPEVTLILKGCIVVLLVLLAVGFIRGDGMGVGRQSIEDRVFGALLWCFGGALAIIALFLIVAGIGFVIGG